jgi:hypothetical protein
LDGVQVCRSAGIFDVVSKRGHPMESKRSGSSVRISFTREEIAEVIKVADDRRDYVERTGLYFAGARPEEQEQWLAAAKLDPETAEVTFTWGDMTDPYWLRACDENSYYGRNYFARSPGGVWVSFDDLPNRCRRGWTLAR